MGAFGTIGYSPIRDNLKVIYLKLSDHFLAENNLAYK